MRAEEAISVSNNYTNQTVIGMGAIKGAPCTIKSMTKVGKLTTTVFEWTDLNGGKHENTMLVYDGTDGTNGTNGQDGAPGADGFSPTIVVKTSTSTEYILTITDKNGSYDTPNLKGSGGGGGASEMSDLTDVDLTNLANGSALIYDSEAAKWEATDLTLSNITDIDLTGIQDGQVLVWDAEHSKLVPADQTGTQYSAGEGINIDQNNAISSKFVLYTGAKETYEAMPLSERVKYTHTAFNNDSQVGLVDAVPTENSPNLVTSGGTYSEIAKKANTTDLANYQTKDLSSPITVDGTQETTVEGALGAVNTLAKGKADPATTLAGYGITNAYTKTETDGAITSEIEKLDVADSAVTGSYVTGVSETDGKISVTREAADASPTSASNKMVKSGGVYNSENDIYKANGILGAKNLIHVEDFTLIKSTARTKSLTTDDFGTGVPKTRVTLSFTVSDSTLTKTGAFRAYGPLVGASRELLGTVEYKDNGDYYFSFNATNLDQFYIFIDNTDDADVTCTFSNIMLRLASDTDSTYQPFAKTNKQLTNDKAELTQISNPNLLDNPWFTVNQRGITTLSEGGDVYTIDRWMKSASTITFTLANDGTVSLTNTGTATPEWRQRIEPEFAEKFLDGKTFTLSVLKDGVVYSATDVYSYSENKILARIDIGDAYVELRNLPTLTYRCFVRVIFKANTQNKTVSGIRAIKLELGSVSTLAMDAAPNYATELLKCQRYFVRLQGTTNCLLGWLRAQNATNLWGFIQMPVPMRAVPSLSYSDLSDWCIEQFSSPTLNQPMTNLTRSDSTTLMIKVKAQIDSSVVTVETNEMLPLKAIKSTAYIDFSADL